MRTDAELLHVHMVLIRDMGMTLGEILDLDELADDCEPTACGSSSHRAADQVHERRRLADQPAGDQVAGRGLQPAARAGGVPGRVG